MPSEDIKEQDCDEVDCTVTDVYSGRVLVSQDAGRSRRLRDVIKDFGVTDVIDLTRTMEPRKGRTCECPSFDVDCYHTNDVRNLDHYTAILQLRDVYTSFSFVAADPARVVLILDASEDGLYGHALALAIAKTSTLSQKSRNHTRLFVMKFGYSAREADEVCNISDSIAQTRCSAPPLVRVPPLRSTSLYSLN